MLLAEKYAQADLNAAFSYREKEGGNKMLYELVQDGDLSVSKAAKKASMSEDKFIRKMQLCGYKLP